MKKKTNKEFISELKNINPDIEVIGQYTKHNEKIDIKCKKCGYEWRALPGNLLRGTGCPRCSIKSKTKTSEQFKKEVASINPDIEVIGTYTNANTKITVKCKKCGHEWDPIAQSILSGHGCPQCYGNIKKTTSSFINELSNVNANIQIVSNYIGNHAPIRVKCKRCGHEWEAIPNNLLRGSDCIVCAGKKQRTNEEFISELAIINKDIDVLGEYKSVEIPIRVKCLLCGHEWKAIPNNLLRGTGCPKCAIEKNATRRRKPQTEFEEELSQINPKIEVLGEYINANTPVRVKCKRCGHEWKAIPNNLLKGVDCPNCLKYLKTSFPEQALYYYIKKKYPRAINGYKDIFNNKMEIDIFIPELNYGIEYDGLFWHESNDSNEREIKKYNICKANGIKLIRIREDNEFRPDISDITINAGDSLYDAINELAKYISLPKDIDIQRDSINIKRQYLLEDMPGTTSYFANKLNSPDIEVLGEYINANTPVRVKCKRCGHEWEATPNGLLSGHGCPRCAIKKNATRRRKTQTEFEEELSQINPKIEVLGEYINYRTKVLVKCKKCGHEWEATPNSLLKGRGCIYCSGFSNNKKSTEQFAKELNVINPTVSIKGEYLSANKSITAKCDICGHEWNTTPSRLLHAQKCPSCSGNMPKTTKSFITDLEKVNPNIIVLGEYKGSKTHIKIKCKKCGHEWEATPNGLLSGHGCPRCYGNIKKTDRAFKTELAKVNPDVEVLGEYINANTPVRVKCKRCGHEWEARPVHLLKGHGCPIEGKAVRKTTEQFTEELSLINNTIEVVGEYKNSKTKITVKCKRCGHEWEVIPNSLLKGHGCPICARKKK